MKACLTHTKHRINGGTIWTSTSPYNKAAAVDLENIGKNNLLNRNCISVEKGETYYCEEFLLLLHFRFVYMLKGDHDCCNDMVENDHKYT